MAEARNLRGGRRTCGQGQYEGEAEGKDAKPQLGGAQGTRSRQAGHVQARCVECGGSPRATRLRTPLPLRVGPHGGQGCLRGPSAPPPVDQEPQRPHQRNLPLQWGWCEWWKAERSSKPPLHPAPCTSPSSWPTLREELTAMAASAALETETWASTHPLPSSPRLFSPESPWDSWSEVRMAFGGGGAAAASRSGAPFSKPSGRSREVRARLAAPVLPEAEGHRSVAGRASATEGLGGLPEPLQLVRSHWSRDPHGAPLRQLRQMARLPACLTLWEVD